MDGLLETPGGGLSLFGAGLPIAAKRNNEKQLNLRHVVNHTVINERHEKYA